MCNYIWGWMLARLIVAIFLKYIQISNHYVVYLKLMQCYMSIIPQQKLKKKKA